MLEKTVSRADSAPGLAAAGVATIVSATSMASTARTRVGLTDFLMLGK